MFKKSLLSKFLVALLCLSFAFTLFGCSNQEKPAKESASSEAAKPADVKTIKFAHVTNTETARHKGALEFKRIVEEETKGAIKVEVYHGAQLGGDRDNIEGVKMGTIQMTVASQGIYANYAPRVGVVGLPFLFDNFEQAWAFNDSELLAEVQKDLLDQNIRVLANWENGFRVLTNSVKPVESVDDVKGLKIRTPEMPVLLETMRALGSNPSPLPFSELYVALQQKAFDGQENPIPLIYNSNLFEVQKYIAIDNHVYDPMPLSINEKFFQSLSPEQQEIVKKAAKAAEKMDRDLIKKQTDDLLKALEDKGMVVTRPDLQPFKEATKDVRNKFEDVYGKELLDKVYNFGK